MIVCISHAKVGYRQAISRSPISQEVGLFVFASSCRAGVVFALMRAACLAIGLAWAASSAGEVLYHLPWPEGLSFMFTQVSDGRITTHFTKATFYAVDIAMPVGVPVLAARGGVVESLEMGQGAAPGEDPLTYEGNFVRVRHEDGTAAVYAHLRHGSAAIVAGQRVEPGQLLAYSGATGDVLEPHLHFAVMRGEASIPVLFYVGAPPIAFAPRAALNVRANYSGPAEIPRTATEFAPLVPWIRPAEEEAGGWRTLALWVACGIAGFALFWMFSRS